MAYVEINFFSYLLHEYGHELRSLLQRSVFLKFRMEEAVSDDLIRFNVFALTLTRPLGSGLTVLSPIYLNSQKPSNVPKKRR